MAVRGSRPIVSPELGARYPFLPGAEGVLADIVPTMRDLLGDPTFGEARDLARARVRLALDDPTGNTELPGLDHALPEMRVLSFFYARLLVSLPPSAAMARRWSVTESKTAWRRLKAPDTADLLAVASALGFEAREEFGEKQDRRIAFSLPSYLRMATPIRETGWRLASQSVGGGVVTVDVPRAARLLQEGIRQYLSSQVPIPLEPALRQALTEREAGLLEEMVRRLPSPQAGSGGPLGFRPEVMPPCMTEMRARLNAGENLSHYGRFALAAFLHKVGANTEFIVDCYRGAPDFDEGITRYQVEHITHHEGGEGYTPPDCAKLISNGLCFKEKDAARPPLCADPVTLKHPLNYYRRRSQAEPARPPAPPSTSSTPATPP